MCMQCINPADLKAKKQFAACVCLLEKEHISAGNWNNELLWTSTQQVLFAQLTNFISLGQNTSAPSTLSYSFLSFCLVDCI